MATLTTSSLTNALYEIRLDKIFNSLYETSDKEGVVNYRIYPFFAKKKAEGKNVDSKKFTIQVGNLGALYPHTEGADVNKTGTTSFIEGTVEAKKFANGFDITHETMEQAAARGVDGIREFLTFVKNNVRDVLDLSLDLFLASQYSDGSGKIAQVKGATTTSTTAVVDNPGIVGGNFWVGMYIDVHNGSTYDAQNVKVTDVDAQNNTLTLESAQSLSDDAYIYLHSAKDSMFDGLMSIISDGTFEGINGSTYSFWKAVDYDGGASSLTETMIDTFLDNIVLKGGGKAPNLMFINPAAKRKLTSILATDRFITNADIAMAGFKIRTAYASDYGDIPFFINRFLTSNAIWALNTGDIALAEFVPIQWLKAGTAGGGTLNIMDGKLDAEAKWFGWFNFYATKRNNAGKLTNFTT